MNPTDHEKWVFPHGTAASEDSAVVIDDATPGWQHTGLRVVELTPERPYSIDLDTWECVVLPLAGSVVVRAQDPFSGENTVHLAGRPSVFAGPSDTAYVPAGCVVTVTSTDASARVALCLAQSKGRARLAFRHVPAEAVEVELRGAGLCSREVRNFATTDVLDAEALIACEVLTPAGNWSSYPPHKHDEHRPGRETELEEIYYFELRHDRLTPGGRAASEKEPFGYARVYGTAERPIDITAEVRTGDVVLVPHGWHGPTMAPPGYDLYYLNVMAGPGPERAWRICDDPRHAWVRDTWPAQAPDPRLPFEVSR